MSETTINKELTVETIRKVNFILFQKTEEETKYDFLLKYILKIIFIQEQNSDTISFPNIPNEVIRLLVKLVELLYILFQKTKKERQEIYKKDSKNIKENNII